MPIYHHDSAALRHCIAWTQSIVKQEMYVIIHPSPLLFFCNNRQPSNPDQWCVGWVRGSSSQVGLTISVSSEALLGRTLEKEDKQTFAKKTKKEKEEKNSFPASLATALLLSTYQKNRRKFRRSVCGTFVFYERVNQLGKTQQQQDKKQRSATFLILYLLFVIVIEISY